MKKNMGQMDRIIRIIIGIILLGLALVVEGGLRWIAGLGAILLLTGIVSFCPLYLPFGINTRKK